MQTAATKFVPALVALLVMLPSAMAQDVTQLRSAMEQAYYAKDYDKAIELCDKLAELQKADPTHPYNLACLWSLKGDKDKAVQQLTRSVELGFADLNLFRTDPDLESIRETEGYKKALERLKKRVEFDFDKAAAESKPIVIIPDGVDKQKATVIVALHPYGGTAEWIVDKWKQVAADAGAVLVAPRAVRKVEGREGYSWGETDEADTLLKGALKALTVEHKIAADKMILTGFSQGAFMTFNLGLRHADKFNAIIPVAGRFSAREAKVPAGGKVRVYMMVGDKDRAASTNRRADEDLSAAGLETRLVVYEDLGHEFPENSVAELKKALAFALAE